MSRQNLWSLDSVAYAHGYDSVTLSHTHDSFAAWLRSFEKKFTIIDVGGGNGRVVLSIQPHFLKYYCLELNDVNIKVGTEFFKENEDVSFIKYDVNSEQVLPFSCDVVYIDSVLTMLENPMQFLLKCKNLCEVVFVNRTHNYEKTERSSFRWGGMSAEETLWKFSHSHLNEFCSLNGMSFKAINDSSFYVEMK